MLIRKAKVKDLEILSKKSLELLKYHQKFDKYFSPSINAKGLLKSFLKKSIYSKNYYLIVAELDKKIVGYALATLSFRPPIFKHREIGFINDVYVDENFRRKGVGKLFLREMLNWFKDNNINNIELAVHSMNNLGNEFWEKEKFLTISHKKHRVI